MKRKKAIGIFDSGFGGLIVMKGILKDLAEYDFVYLGDTARIPYGTRSKEIVYEFTKQAVDFLFGHGCELIVSACNTVSSDALRKIQTEYMPKKYPRKKILGVIIPAAEKAAGATKNKKVGVIATQGTVESGSFVREFAKVDKKIKIFQKACPLLVPIVEAGEQKNKITGIILQKYLESIKGKKIDTLVLGCTHYGILEPEIRKIMGKNIRIISQSRIIGKKLKEYLVRHPEIEKKLKKTRKRIYCTTDLSENFNNFGSRILGQKIRAKKINLK